MIATYLTLLATCTALSFLLLRFAGRGYSGCHFIAAILGLAAGFAATVGTISGLFMCWGWYSAGYTADVVNRECGTNYTQHEIYFAPRALNAVQVQGCKRVQLHGGDE